MTFLLINQKASTAKRWHLRVISLLSLFVVLATGIYCPSNYSYIWHASSWRNVHQFYHHVQNRKHAVENSIELKICKVAVARQTSSIATVSVTAQWQSGRVCLPKYLIIVWRRCDFSVGLVISRRGFTPNLCRRDRNGFSMGAGPRSLVPTIRPTTTDSLDAGFSMINRVPYFCI